MAVPTIDAAMTSATESRFFVVGALTAMVGAAAVELDTAISFPLNLEARVSGGAQCLKRKKPAAAQGCSRWLSWSSTARRRSAGGKTGYPR
jgi:hypothetical protein